MLPRHAPQPHFLDFAEIRPYLKLLRKNLWLFILLGAIGFSAGRLITFRQLDVHSATAEILLRQNEGSEARYRMLGELNGRRSADDIQNQLRIIQSYDLVGKAVDRLSDPIDYFFVGRIRTTQVAGFSNLDIDVLPGLCHPDLLEKNIDLFVLDETRFQLRYTRGDGSEVNSTFFFNVPIEGPDLAMTVRFTEGIGQIEQAQKQHFRIRIFNREGRIAQFRQGLSVENIDRTSILRVNATNTLPGRAKQFLDTLGAVYIDYTELAKLESSFQTEVFINERLSDLVIILDSLEREAEYYRASHGLLDLDREQSEEFNALTSFEGQLRILKLRLAAIGSMLDHFAAGHPDEGLPPGYQLHGEDPVLSEMFSRLTQLRNNRNVALIDVTEANYSIRKLDSSIQATRFNLVRYLEGSRRALLTQKKMLDAEISDLERRLGDFPSTKRDLLTLERKLKVNEDLYVFLLEAQANSFIDRAGVAPSASIVEHARSGGVVGPDKRRTIALTTGLGLFVALVIAVVRQLFFTRIESLEELKEATTLPTLGAIPHYEVIADCPIAILQDSRSQVTESLRGIRTGLHYLLQRQGPATILISSMHPGEGKSFVSANLAAVLAKTGKRVALVDLDLHKPRVHTYFKLPNGRGVSSFLVGDLTCDDIHLSGPLPALDIYTSGPVPPNASELIFSERLGSLLLSLKDRYDYVVLDTPPILLITDALVIMQYVDLGIFILNAERTRLNTLRKLEDILKTNGIANTALALNNVSISRWQKMIYRYASKYGYGYSDHYGISSSSAPEKESDSVRSV